MRAAAALVSLALLGCAPAGERERDAGEGGEGEGEGEGEGDAPTPCTGDPDCGIDELCFADARCGGACVPLLDEGAACDAGGPLNATCQVVAGACAAGLSCVALDVADLCIVPGVVGAPCTGGADCDSGICGTSGLGEPLRCAPNDCAHDGDCVDGDVCMTQRDCGRTCVPPAPFAAQCSYFVQPEDASCVETRACAAGLECVTTTGVDSAIGSCALP